MSDDMRARMLRTVTGPTPQAQPMPSAGDVTPGAVAAARPNPYPRRVTLDLSEEDHRALRLASLDLHVPMTQLLRELVRQWRENSLPGPTQSVAGHE